MDKRFHTVDTAHAFRNGQACRVIRSIVAPDNEHDAEVLPMHVIEFADGAQLEVFDDELA